MFQYGQVGNALFQVAHQHSDGSWGTMEPEEVGEHHDPAAHDPEREWQRGHIFVCRSCGERVRVNVPEGPQPAG